MVSNCEIVTYFDNMRMLYASAAYIQVYFRLDIIMDVSANIYVLQIPSAFTSAAYIFKCITY